MLGDVLNITEVMRGAAGSHLNESVRMVHRPHLVEPPARTAAAPLAGTSPPCRALAAPSGRCSTTWRSSTRAPPARGASSSSASWAHTSRCCRRTCAARRRCPRAVRRARGPSRPASPKPSPPPLPARPRSLLAPGRPARSHGAPVLTPGRARRRATDCGSCYGASPDPNACCNSCDDIRSAYRQRKWGFPGENNFEQCRREQQRRAQRREEGEGCNVYGTMEVARVTGSFHLAPASRAKGSQRLLGQLLIPPKLAPEEVGHFNVTHQIKRLSFGTDFPGQAPYLPISPHIFPGQAPPPAPRPGPRPAHSPCSLAPACALRPISPPPRPPPPDQPAGRGVDALAERRRRRALLP